MIGWHTLLGRPVAKDPTLLLVVASHETKTSSVVLRYQPKRIFPQPANVLPGLELWGRNIYVQQNMISGYPYAGIGASSVYNLTIDDQNQINGDSTQFTTGGIQVHASFPGGVCDQIPRDTQTVTITNNTSNGQSYGVDLDDANEASRNTINGLSIQNNVLGNVPIGIAPIVVLNDYPVPPNQPTTPKSGDSVTPRVLPVDVGTALSKCGAASATRATFTFQAAELTGASNIATVQVVISSGGTDSDGSNGPTTPLCHFGWFSGDRKVYMDGPDGAYNWLKSSVIGAQGVDLTNYDSQSSYPANCTIHAGSSSSHLDTTQPYVLDLTLDIEFLKPISDTNQHIYILAENSNAQWTNGMLLTYTGYWTVPTIN